jgi:predicted DNA-binding transcriptional regulator AlpA
MDFDQLSDAALISLRDLTGPHRLIPLSRSSIYAFVARDEFPAPVRISRRRVAWRVGDLRAWLSSRPKSGDCR